METIEGRVWKFGDHVDTDQIIPAERLTSDNIDRLGDFIFEKVRPEMAAELEEGDIIVAGRNFGCGSSREHAPRALKQAGISGVVAESFARIFYRNCLNVGLLPLECDIEAEQGDVLSIDVEGGTILNESSQERWQFSPFPAFIIDLITSGGLMEKVKERLECSR